MVARPVLDVPLMNISCDGVIVPGSAWERYSFAHPEASVSDFLYATGPSNDVRAMHFASTWMTPIL
jgi:hypothetical protein